LSGVQRDHKVDVPYSQDFDPDCRLIRAATAVLERLALAAADTRTSIFLADNQVRIVDRRAGEPSLNAHLDRLCLAPGFVYAEDLVGTNGLGTAVVERKPVQVVGSEHFVRPLHALSCFGAPIIHPISGRMEGVLDVTCRWEDTSYSTVPLLLVAVREIETWLYEESTVGERVLLECFLTLTRRSHRPIVSMNEDLVITNVAAARLLEPADHALLWERAAEALATHQETVTQLCLASGVIASAHCHEITHSGTKAGALIEIDVKKPSTGHWGAAKPSRHQAQPPLAGRSAAWQAVCAAIAEEAQSELALLIVGEPGVGKLSVARAVHQRRLRGGPLSVLDAGLANPRDAKELLGSIRQRLKEAAGTIVISHVEMLSARAARSVCSLLDRSNGSAGLRVIGTLTHALGTSDAAELQPLTDRFCTRIVVPPLRERPEDISDLVSALVRQHDVGGRERRCRPEVLQALMRMEWPGNVRQLESLIRGILAQCPSGDIVLDDLPPESRRSIPSRPLGHLEWLERVAIMAELTATRGNKKKAAARLGISRATLYRKLRSLDIDLEHLAF
jgi:transcriptional regulator of acetoin/glycerol metabolism